MNASQPIESPTAKLLPLAAALAPYFVPIRTGRRLVRQGRLAAVKVGREYLVDPVDVAALFKPTLRVVSDGARQRESNRAREERQLAEAGIAADK